MITNSKKVLTTSVNLKFDIGNKEFIQRYLPTPSHAQFLKSIIGGFIGDKKSNAHIMIGPYGSGKSLAATIIADIFSNNISPQDFNKLINKFKDVDQEIYKKLSVAQSSKINFIPVVLSGNEGSFNRTIINSIIKAVEKAGFDIDLPGEAEGIRGIVENWELEFPKTFILFKKSLKTRGYNVDKWKSEIKDNNQQEVNWFKSEYSLLSAGAKFQIDYETNFIDKISQIIAHLKEKNIRLFVVYDEFGRFLQSLEVSQIYNTMQDLQDIAEVANRSENTLQLLLISHKNMSQYMLGHNEEFKAEFQRIEKRFKTYFIESDKATFYRIAQEYTRNIQKEFQVVNQGNEKEELLLKKYNLFSELNHQEIDKLILEGSFPLHPLALFLLPRLSSIFGQNERTLFTFLESDETGGLNNTIMKNKKNVYYPHMLFDYFFQNHTNEFVFDESFRSLRTFTKILSKIKITPKNTGQINLLKIITLWDLSSSTNVVKLNEELLTYGTGQTKEELEKNLEQLVNQKMIRFNRILGQWELSEGSSILIDELLEKEREVLKIDDDSRIKTLNELLEKKFYLATDYNDEKNITRFMQVNVITSDYLAKDSYLQEINFNGDGQIYYVIPSDEHGYRKSISKGTLIKNKHLIFSVSNRKFSSIKATLDRLISLQSLSMNTSLISEHYKLDEEIDVLLAETQFEIRDFLKDFEEFRENVRWFYLKEQIKVEHQVELENKISKVMFKLYPETPEIRNDSINRRNLNGMQTKAIYSVLNNLIKNPNFEQLGIEGQGPDYLIYATVFKNNNLDVNNFSNLEYSPYSNLREKLKNHLKETKKGTMSSIEFIFTASPYGIRKPLIPLLFVALLRDVWEQLMFYRNGMYVTAIDAEKLYGIFKEPDEYEFVFNDYSSEFLQFVSGVEKVFHEYESEYVRDQTIVIRASSGLLNWLRQLPRHSQTTEQMSRSLLEFKTMARRIEVNPINSLEMLQANFQDPLSLAKMKGELERHFDEFKEEVTNKLYENFHVNSLDKLLDLLNLYSPELIKRNRLLKSIDAKVENFIEQFSLNYTGVELSNWSDTTFDLFVRQMQNDYRDMEMSSENKDTILLGYNDSHKSIKKVELSNKALTVYENVNRIINNAGRSVPREEIEYLVFKLLDEYID